MISVLSETVRDGQLMIHCIWDWGIFLKEWMRNQLFSVLHLCEWLFLLKE